ncbi:MAG TPA: asparagine synthase (glutamine-hydrolyzing) [Candidatus Omnitrophica bacterium]|nr:asparagine synthase (glutamine-hydrolyzing) [Candidatus Omnitrophota bacterium]
MCGIAGIIADNKRNVNQRSLRIMGDTLRHRGPDDEGFFIFDNVGFVHKRLSIIDISGGHQPMSNEDGSIWIVYNGEIYNYIELRKELISLGHRFKTHSDTEVIIHLYEQCGRKALLKLNGMFAFTIYDKRKKIIFAARDHFGIKPYYYAFNRREFIFASEIKAIVNIRPAYREENPSALYDYMTFQFCLGDKTFFKGIKKLLPGHFMVLEGVGNSPRLTVHKYWDLDFRTDFSRKEKYFKDKLGALIKDSVRLQLRSDVPLGAHLSGGLDSSIVTTIASCGYKSRLKTFTGAFSEGAEYDETRYARLVSRSTKSNYFEVRPTHNDFRKNIEKIIYMMDEPTAGPGVFPQFFVSRLASENVKVVLGGQGGDEIFGGYARYLIAYLEQCLKRSISKSNDEGKDVISLDSIIPNLGALKEYLPLMRSFWSKGVFNDMDCRYFSLINRATSTENLYSREMLDYGKKYDIFSCFKQIFNLPNTKSYINKMIHFDIKTLLPALLHVEDRTSMSFSLESRVPLLDYRIAEFSAKVPVGIKLKGGINKYLLRSVARGIVPDEITNRKDKMGFPVPISLWFKGELKSFIWDILTSRRARGRGIYDIGGIKKAIDVQGKFDRGIWGLLCLELWFSEFIDK